METLLCMNEKLRQASQSEKYGADVLMTACLAELLVYVNSLYRDFKQEQPAAADKTIGAVMDYIDANLSPELSLQSIAACFSIDRYYLSHLFRQQTGSTLYQYILIKKIAAAKQYLLDGKTVTETCYLSGFNDYNNFIRTFKKMTGVSPGHYSREQRAK